jgi:hypothetical protein
MRAGKSERETERNHRPAPQRYYDPVPSWPSDRGRTDRRAHGRARACPARAAGGGKAGGQIRSSSPRAAAEVGTRRPGPSKEWPRGRARTRLLRARAVWVPLPPPPTASFLCYSRGPVHEAPPVMEASGGAGAEGRRAGRRCAHHVSRQHSPARLPSFSRIPAAAATRT